MAAFVNSSSISLENPAHSTPLSPGLIALFAFCCGAIVGNLYYAQPIVGLIAPDLHVSVESASLIVSMTQIGYALGLFFVVPLGDLLENRKLMIWTAIASIFSLAAAAFTHQSTVFLLVSLLIGFSSVSVQLLIPLAAHLAPEKTRGQVVGSIMSGLLMGILLARPVSSFVTDHLGWRAMFGIAAVLMCLITVVLATLMPKRQPAHKATYSQLIGSLATLLKTEPVLRQRSLFQGCMFAIFSLYWTAVPLELTARYGMSQSQIALFALVGAMGAVAAPVSGRLADKGHTKAITLVALGLGTLCLMPAVFSPGYGLAGLVISGVLLDFAVQSNMVVSQREIYALHPNVRNRLNAVYMTSLFIFAALGSSVASLIYTHGGWPMVALLGSSFPLLAFLGYAWVSRKQAL